MILLSTEEYDPRSGQIDVQFLGTFAENDAPAIPCFGVFHRPNTGWFAALWTEETGPFKERGEAEEHLKRYTPSYADSWFDIWRKVGTLVFGSTVLLMIFFIVATVLIQLERAGFHF